VDAGETLSIPLGPTPEGGFTGNLLANASDAEGNPLSVTSVTLDNGLPGGVPIEVGVPTQVNGGLLTVNADGTYTFDRDDTLLALGPNLTTNFAYTVDDGQGGTATSSASLVVELPVPVLPAAPPPPPPEPVAPPPVVEPSPALSFAQQVIAAGSTDDGYANHNELAAGFAALGLTLQQTGVSSTAGTTADDVTSGLPPVLSGAVAPLADVIAGISNLFGGGGSDTSPGSTPQATLNRLIAAYSTTGNGALSPEELAQALDDGAFDVGPDTVTINNDVVQAKLAQGGASNVAARVVGAGSQDDALANRGELQAGFAAAGWDLQQGDDLDTVIAAYSGGAGALSPDQLAQAIQDGAIAPQKDGRLVVDPSKVTAQEEWAFGGY
jgi:hypothetical protein